MITTKYPLSTFLLLLFIVVSNQGFGQCLSDDFNSGYGNWIGTGTYQNTTAGITGNGVGFNSIGDEIITSSLLSNPQTLTMWLARSSSTANKTFSVQYALSNSGPWTSVRDILVGEVTTTHQEFISNFNLTGDYYIRIAITQRTGGTYYLDNVSVTCNSSPIITVGLDITSLDYTFGSGPSTEKTTTVSGVNLTNNIFLTAPTNFEISATSGSGFGSSINLTPSSGTVSTATIYTRLQSGLSINSYSGNIIATSTGATSQNIGLSGNVTAVSISCLNEDFVDFSDWTDSGSANDTASSHYGSASPCRALGSGDNLISASVDNPISLEFYQDASSGGNGNTATVDYKIGANSWVSLHSFNVTTAGNIETIDLTNVSGVDLSLESDVTFRFNSSFNTWYLDDVKVDCSDPCASAHTVTSFTPTSGPINTEVTIVGTGFTGSTVVSLGGVAISISSQTATELKVTIPSGSATGGFTVSEGVCDVLTSNFTIIDNDATTCDGSVSASELFISEVTDATTGSLSYIEIYNGTGSAIADLSIYSLKIRYNAGVTTNTIVLSGSVANDDVFVVSTKLDATCSVPGGDGTFADQNASTINGIDVGANSSDCITLIKSGTDIDVWGDCGDNNWRVNLGLSIGDRGFDFRRLSAVTLPNTTFSSSDWDIINFDDSSCSEDYYDVGNYSLSSLPTLVNQSYSPPSCSNDATFYVNVIEGFDEVGDTKELAYQWFEVAPGVASWTTLTDAGIYSGATTSSLSISSTVGLEGYQYYCQIKEDDVNCFIASNTVIIATTTTNIVTWNGSWSNGGGPTTTSIVTLNSDYATSVNGSFSCCSLTLNTNVTLDIDTTFVSVENDVTINNGAELNVETDASLIMIYDDGAVALNGTGMINVNKITSPYEKYDYTYWSSPIVDETIGDALSGSYAPMIFYYNSANFYDANLDGFDDNQDDWVRVGGAHVMSSGRGYVAMGAITGTFSPTQIQNATFSGEVNNGVITEIVATNSSPNTSVYDYNLVGNPYPSAISADEFILQNPNVGGTLYFWTHVDDISISNPGPDAQNFHPDDYATYNLTGGVATAAASNSGSNAPNGFIGSGQAFFIGADSNGTVQFNNSMRNIGFVNTQFFRTATNNDPLRVKDRVWLDLTNEDGAFNQTLIGFFDEATQGYDRRYDGEYLNSNTYLSLYSRMNETSYTIQGKPTFKLDDKIILGFEANIVGNLKLSISQLEGILSSEDVSIFLIDNDLEVVHNLKESDYNFEISQSGTYNNRFEIVFQEPQSILSIEDITDFKSLLISNELDAILVKYLTNNDEVIADLKIYDVLGRELFNKKVNENELYISSNSFAEGSLLIFKVQLSNGVVLSKKFIKF